MRKCNEEGNALSYTGVKSLRLTVDGTNSFAVACKAAAAFLSDPFPGSDFFLSATIMSLCLGMIGMMVVQSIK